MRKVIIAAVLLGSVWARQDTTTVQAPREPGYLVVESDSAGLSIYVDNMLVGSSPIQTPIPLSPGRHMVTYLPPGLIDLLQTHYDPDEISGLLTNSVKTVYVVAGETVAVQLWWSPFEQELKIRKKRFWTKSMVGVALLAVVLGLNLL